MQSHLIKNGTNTSSELPETAPAFQAFTTSCGLPSIGVIFLVIHTGQKILLHYLH